MLSNPRELSSYDVVSSVIGAPKYLFPVDGDVYTKLNRK